MNIHKWLLFAAVLLLVGSTAGYLQRVKAGHKLGPPGLKLIEAPVYDPSSNVVGTTTVDLPVEVLDYESVPLPVTKIELDWLPRDTTFGRRRYVAPDGFRIDLSVVLMGTDRTSIHKPQICLTGQGWSIDRSDLLTVRVERPHPYDLPLMRLTATGQFQSAPGEVETVKGVYVYWFVSDKRLTAKHGERMWWMAKDLLTTRMLPRWAYISFFSACRPGAEEAVYARMKEFIAASVPEFQLVTGPPVEGAERRVSMLAE